MKLNICMVLMTLFLSPLYIQVQTDIPKGIIKGKVVDGESKLDLVGAQIFIREKQSWNIYEQ